MLVSSSGQVIWDSADCTRGRPNKVAELRRGVPAQESLSWNRTISLPGCVTVASSARPGTYQGHQRGQPGPHLQTVPLGLGAQNGGERLTDVLHLLHLHQVGKAVGALQGRS